MAEQRPARFVRPAHRNPHRRCRPGSESSSQNRVETGLLQQAVKDQFMDQLGRVADNAPVSKLSDASWSGCRFKQAQDEPCVRECFDRIQFGAVGLAAFRFEPSGTLHGGDMHNHILASAFRLDKAKSFGRVAAFQGSSGHICAPLFDRCPQNAATRPSQSATIN
jgi:hypothetical protein